MADNNFQPGDTLLHKATLKRCVVIKINDDGTIKVRDADNKENDYYPVELRTYKLGAVKRGRNLY